MCQLSIVLREGLTFDISTAIKGTCDKYQTENSVLFFITVTVYSVQRQR